MNKTSAKTSANEALKMAIILCLALMTYQALLTGLTRQTIVLLFGVT